MIPGNGSGEDRLCSIRERAHSYGGAGDDSLGEGEADLERYLIVGDAAVLDVAASLDDLEPAYVADRGGGAGDRLLDRVLDAGLGATDDLDDLVDFVAHE